MTRKKSERELEQLQHSLEYKNKTLRVFLADILPEDFDVRNTMEERMLELENLVNTYWGVVIVKHIQNKSRADYNTFIGSGKLDQIIEEMEKEEANLLIIWNILKSRQIYNIDEKLKDIWAKAWDRIDLILKIFEKNAKTKESLLQIELASLKHMWPRIFDMWEELWSQGRWGSRLSRWKWETNTEIMKRYLREREKTIREELRHFEKIRQEHRKNRTRKWMNVVWVVWYTNAWKSTLTNALTKKWVLVEDKLFATLWTSVWKMFVEPSYDENTWEYIKWKEVLISDTIWFIRDLPPELIEAFKSTLEDSIESDLLLHVIDVWDDDMEVKIEVVEDILNKIWAKQERLYIFNKSDTIEKWKYIIEIEWEIKEYKNKKEYIKEKYSELNPIFISAENKENLEELKEKIIEKL